MVASPWLKVALTAVSLLPAAVTAIDVCPARCVDAGPNPGNWSVYPNFNMIKRCQQTMFYGFSLYDPVDDTDSTHRIAACSSYGTDFINMKSEPVAARLLDAASPVDVEFELGWWHEGFGLATAAIQSLVAQTREYIENGHGPSDRSFILYGRSGQATIGVYIGRGLLNQGLSASALKTFEDNFDTLGVTTPSLAMQLCGPDYDGTQTFGVVVASNATFAPIQRAIKSWANATCLSFTDSTKFPGKATFTTPLLNGTVTSNSTISARSGLLEARADCKTVQVESGNGCAELAVKCGISGANFEKYNPGICNKLKPKQHVCCSSGTLPDFRPKPQADGSCFAYDVQDNDNCANLGAEFGLTNEEIESFNKNTWGWSGCELLYAKTKMCLSKGTPPFPAPIPNAACGPQKPGSQPPTDGKNISDMNPCPLNACCNIWGQCGITRDFCIDTNTGPPGTAKNGTYGCISNCGVDVVKGTGSGAIKLAYFQGYGMNRKCLYQDALQIDTSKYTHLHFGFGTLTPTYDVKVGDALSSYQFNEFKRVPNAKRILSFGGWDFSTFPDTYYIFREGVKPANRMKMATNIANFIKKHELDGVDIDWEYPGAPDLPDFDPGKKEDGPNYLAFLAVLKNLLPGKSVAIAAPASYWYLKQFPIKEISKVVDYIVYMTYDLHGQWDAHNEYSQEDCDTGNCLRSQVNLTETRQALAMITKAGVPGNKIVVGVTSYGRSFQMAEPGCWGPGCKFTGDRLTSYATPGRCTGTAGYIADAEIKEIINGGSGLKRQNRVVKSFLDASSNSDILVYDNNQWVGYMSESTKAVRAKLYAGLGMAGTTDWASDLQEFNPAPKPAKDWASFIAMAASGNDPKESTTSIGKWKDFHCKTDVVFDPFKASPENRWKAVDADSAWREVVSKWFSTDRGQYLTFSQSLERTLKSGSSMGCESFNGQMDNCDKTIDCPDGANGESSGPAAQFIWNSVITIHKMYHSYRETLFKLIGPFANGADDMEDTFAPIPEEKTNQWLNILIDLLTIGTLGGAAPFFNGFLKTLPAFSKPNTNTFDNTKDTVLMLMGQTTTLAKDMLSSPDQDKWTPSEQNKFSNYMNQVIFGWMNATEFTLGKLFGGENTYVTLLGDLISNGKFIDGAREGKAPALPTAGDVEANIFKTIYGYSIPALWRRSKTYAFVIDSGEGCDGNPLSKYVDDDTAKVTSVCYDDTLYYLVHPDGEARPCECERTTDMGPCQTVCRDNKFSAPVGLDRLGDFGKLEVADLIKGSVNTWRHNKKENKRLNITEMALEKATQSNLLDVNIQTAGFVQLPVCSADRAFQSWRTGKKGGSDNYPCDIPPGKSHCGDSSFENQGSNASPSVDDCKQIIKNIEGDASTEFTHRITGHREILKYGSCAFGIERTGGTGGAVEFRVGGQDVIDIINDAIKQFGGGGKVGAKGVMSCSGTTAGTKVNVEWGIY
ncbi:Killer toxin subunits alpha/beta 2 [Colletotrichum chlorophyti]|uniref:chitinase n=1 Tax=Colletotrichum chlorophyti TaxID=708187 RepID=A0A1Q8S5W8_9PEZI|nr:Killer toxin subunits alpha/beta 2 [Colletotrichum chlorophyti]